MPADLSKVVPILNRDEQEEAGLRRVFRADAPAASDVARVIKDVLTAGRVNNRNYELYLLLAIEISERRLEFALRGLCDYADVIVNVTGGRRKWRLRRLGGPERRREQAHREKRPNVVSRFQCQTVVTAIVRNLDAVGKNDGQCSGLRARDPDEMR